MPTPFLNYPADYAPYIKNQVFQSLTQGNDGNRVSAELDAQSFITSFLGQIYDCGQIFGATGAVRNSEIIRIMIFIVLYRLSGTVSPDVVPERFGKDFDNSVKWLEMARKRDIVPNLPYLSHLDEHGMPKPEEYNRYSNRKKFRSDWIGGNMLPDPYFRINGEPGGCEDDGY